MDWGQHVSKISSKATKTLDFLRRNMAFAPRSTKAVAYKTLVWPKLEYAAPIWSPHSKLKINQIERVRRTAARWTCRRWRNTGSVSEMLDELEWPSLEARRYQSSLLLFNKIHCGAVSIEKDKYMTPALSLNTHHIVLNTADTRHTVMPWRIPFSPKQFHIGIVCLLLRPMSSPQRSLRHSFFKQKFSQKLLLFFVCVFLLLFFVFYFIKISKFALPGVMLTSERSQYDRKTEKQYSHSASFKIGHNNQPSLPNWDDCIPTWKGHKIYFTKPGQNTNTQLEQQQTVNQQ